MERVKGNLCFQRACMGDLAFLDKVAGDAYLFRVNFVRYLASRNKEVRGVDRVTLSGKAKENSKAGDIGGQGNGGTGSNPASDQMAGTAAESKEIPHEEMTRDQLIEKIQASQAEAGKNFDLYLRSRAEIENLKRRFQRDKEDLSKFANEVLIKQLLPVIDNLEKALEHAQGQDALDALKEGVSLTLKGLKDVLIKEGLAEVKAEGAPFDPNYHEALMQKEDDSVPEGTVLQACQTGYILNERLVRPALVVVSKGKDTGDS
jgi:molecular chaperone GrpE